MTSNTLVQDDPFAIAQQQLDLVAARLGLDEGTHLGLDEGTHLGLDEGTQQILRFPNRELTVTFMGLTSPPYSPASRSKAKSVLFLKATTSRMRNSSHFSVTSSSRLLWKTRSRLATRR